MSDGLAVYFCGSVAAVIGGGGSCCNCYLAYVAPLVFVGPTSALVVVKGFKLKWQRLQHAFPYFFAEARTYRKRLMILLSATF